MARLRKVAFGLFWLSLGIVLGAVAVGSFNAYPPYQTGHDDYTPIMAVPGTQKLLHLDWSGPKSLTVGDNGYVKFHVTNKAMKITDPRTNRIVDIQYLVRLKSPANCSVVDTFAPLNFKPEIFPRIGETNSWDWSIVAEKPGVCELDFIAQMPGIDSAHIDSMDVQIRGRFSPSDMALIIAAAIGGIGAVVAALIGVYGRKKAET